MTSSDPTTVPGPEPITAYLINKPLREAVGDYVLFLVRPGGPMMGMGGSAIFVLTELPTLNLATGTKSGFYTCGTEHGCIMFPADTPYLVIPRALATPMTTREAVTASKAEEEAWSAAYEALTPPSVDPERAVPGTGATGYL